jgi:ribosome-associated protein
MRARDDDPPPGQPPAGVPVEPSKSRAKRAAAGLKELGDELVALPEAELEALALPEKLADAIALAQRITAHGARVRQRQYIGKLLRQVDVSEIRACITRRALDRRIAARDFQRVEDWRERLMTEGEAAFEALRTSAPAIDAARLRVLVAAARAEAGAGRAPTAARALFRFLRSALAPEEPSA